LSVGYNLQNSRFRRLHRS